VQPRWYFAATLAALPGSALAHSPMPGIGEFYGGMLHPVLVLSHLLALLVFALLVGQRGVRAMQITYPPFMLALCIGLFIAGFERQPALPNETLLLTLAMLLGLLVAAQRPPPEGLLSILGAALALLVGMDSGVPDLPRRETFAALLGCWLGATLLLVMFAGVTEMAQRNWQRIVVRVAGSWTTASAVLVLTLALRSI
jgi:urease accessory protein